MSKPQQTQQKIKRETNVIKLFYGLAFFNEAALALLKKESRIDCDFTRTA
jgi:hypothetical protein